MVHNADFGGGGVLLQVIEYSRIGNGADTLERGMTLGTRRLDDSLGLAHKTKESRNRTYFLYSTYTNTIVTRSWELTEKPPVDIQWIAGYFVSLTQE